MPSKVLTDRFVDTVKPTSRRVEYFDAHTPGLAIRVSTRGRKTWILLYRTQPDEETQHAPRLRRLTLGRYPDLDVKGARKQAQIERGKVAKGKDPAAAKQAVRRTARMGDTIGDLAKDYIEKYAKAHKRSWRDDQRYLDAEVLPAWKRIKVKQLQRRDVRALIDSIADRGSPISANRCLALVRKMLNWGVSQDWLDANPAALMAKPGKETSRERVLTDDEIRLVWAACETERPIMCALMRLRLMTAQRGGELSGLKWTDIEGDWLTIPGTLTKNKLAHRVPLTKAAQDILKSVPRLEDNEHAFPGAVTNRPLGDVKKAGQRIAKVVLAKLQERDSSIDSFDFRGHDLRRTASTKMAEAGVPQSDISKVLNHVEGGPRATMVYNRYAYDREKRLALETWGRVLTRILEPKQERRVVPISTTKRKGRP
jgi:integrase